jgi:hypothetical protein
MDGQGMSPLEKGIRAGAPDELLSRLLVAEVVQRPPAPGRGLLAFTAIEFQCSDAIVGKILEFLPEAAGHPDMQYLNKEQHARLVAAAQLHAPMSAVPPIAARAEMNKLVVYEQGWNGDFPAVVPLKLPRTFTIVGGTKDADTAADFAAALKLVTNKDFQGAVLEAIADTQNDVIFKISHDLRGGFFGVKGSATLQVLRSFEGNIHAYAQIGGTEATKKTTTKVVDAGAVSTKKPTEKGHHVVTKVSSSHATAAAPNVMIAKQVAVKGNFFAGFCTFSCGHFFFFSLQMVFWLCKQIFWRSDLFDFPFSPQTATPK